MEAQGQIHLGQDQHPDEDHRDLAPAGRPRKRGQIK